MRRIRNIILLAGLAGMLFSCVTSEKINYMQQPGKHHIPSYPDTLDFTDYKLRIGDRLYIQVYSTDEKTSSLYNGGLTNNQTYYQSTQGNGSGTELYTYLIYDDGTINFPTLGKVEVRGLTTRETKYKLEELLTGVVKQQEGYKNISVEVRIVRRTFSVIGPTKSGQFSIPKEKLNIFEALAIAGDLTDNADRHNIRIIRVIEGETTVRSFDVRSRDIIDSEFYYIEPDDVIYVRYRSGYSFNLNNVGSVISLTASVISFGVFVYTLVDNYVVQPIKTARSK